jgi:hypothetical protein
VTLIAYQKGADRMMARVQGNEALPLRPWSPSGLSQSRVFWPLRRPYPGESRWPTWFKFRRCPTPHAGLRWSELCPPMRPGREHVKSHLLRRKTCRLRIGSDDAQARRPHRYWHSGWHWGDPETTCVPAFRRYGRRRDRADRPHNQQDRPTLTLLGNGSLAAVGSA